MQGRISCKYLFSLLPCLFKPGGNTVYHALKYITLNKWHPRNNLYLQTVFTRGPDPRTPEVVMTHERVPGEGIVVVTESDILTLLALVKRKTCLRIRTRASGHCFSGTPLFLQIINRGDSGRGTDE